MGCKTLKRQHVGALGGRVRRARRAHPEQKQIPRYARNDSGGASEGRRDAGLPDTQTVGTPGKGNRDTEGAPHKQGESPSGLRASRRYKCNYAVGA